MRPHSEGKVDKGKRHVTVLAMPPILIAQDAVRAAIIQEHRESLKGENGKSKRKAGR
jgi:hypothetical protein